MKIAEIAVFRRDFKLSKPSVISYESTETAPNVVVRVELEDGLTGWGNAAPDSYVTGETGESVERTIEVIFRPALIGMKASPVRSIWLRLCELAPEQPSAIAAIDIALYDLLGKTAGIPLCRLLGHARDNIVTSVTLSIEETTTNVARARDLQSRGFKALKIKCGLNVEQDIDRVIAIRAAVGDEMRISLDANQGYSVRETLRVVDALVDCDISFIEQPVAADDLEGLREVCERSRVPVMADESVLGARDVLVTPAPLVNLKLMKAGGVTGVLEANEAAESRGIRAMMGCMDESRISIAAAAHITLALENITYADLDGHLDIIDDVARGGISIEDGLISLSESAGLGVIV
jgi:L-alanine-DL-glutamate epimerase-like enolase superfamily enzyme